MSAEWQRVRAVFHDALAWPPAEREARLDKACAGDAALRAEVGSLLDAHVEAEMFLEQPLAQLVDAPSAGSGGSDGTSEAEPQRIGPYAVRRCLGHGGMGTVFLAVRDDDTYQDQVAIKIIRHDWATEEMVARFRRERQLLADLRDPSIAQLLDGGTTDDGRPYLVMEFVDGERIDAFCDRLRLTIAARLRLFVTVCRAVHHAHQRLVVHRDLKPANLLVTEDGHPKLLDFGVAKLLPSDEVASDLALTHDRAPMTLDYASPEQVLGRPVTTASDVYALGVVLFELLTGERPFRLGGMAPEEMIATVRDREPPTASDIVLTGSARPEAPSRAASRGLSPARLAKQLGGDLDTIVARALHKDPARRYASAEDLAQDIERHLTGLPVRARPDRVAYRMGKFVRRHRWGVAASAMALIALLGFVVALVHKQREVVHENHRATITTDFLVDLFDLSNPDAFFEDATLRALYPEHLRGQDTNARQLLNVGVRRVDELAEEPDVQASLLATMGRAYQGLGLFTRAGELFEQALALIENGADGAPASLLVRLGGVRRDQARFGDAGLLLRQAIATAGDDVNGTAIRSEAHGELARMAVEQGRFDDAVQEADRALSLAQEAYGPKHPKVAAALAARGDAAREGGDRVGAARDFEAASVLYRERYGEPHPRLAEIQQFMGLLDRENGDADAAEQAYRHALAQRREIHEAPHPAIARSLHNLADVLREAGEPRKLDEADALAHESLAMWEEIHGARHPTVGLGLNLIGLVHAANGDFEAAESHHRQALDLWEPTLDPSHVWLASAHNNLAFALARQGRVDEAESHYQQALAGYRARFERPHFQTARVLSNLGGLLRRKDVTAAEDAYREALDIQREALPPGHPDRLATLNNLAVLLLTAERPAEAEPMAREAVASYVEQLGPDHEKVGATRITLAAVLVALGRTDEAIAAYQEAQRILLAIFPPDHGWCVYVAEKLAALGEPPD